MNWPKLVFIALVLFGALNWWSGREVSLPPGVHAADLPAQSSVSGEREFTRNGYRIRALARFEVSARVLGAEHYRLDREAQLAPVDLALGWGRMSDRNQGRPSWRSLTPATSTTQKAPPTSGTMRPKGAGTPAVLTRRMGMSSPTPATTRGNR